jgi:hypothetical protein
MPAQLTLETLSVLFGILLSVLCSYAPRVKTKWNALDGDAKRVVMLVSLFLITLALFGASCTQFKDSFAILSAVSCTQNGAIDLFKLFVSAVVANQAAFMLSPQPKDPGAW